MRGVFEEISFESVLMSLVWVDLAPQPWWHHPGLSDSSGLERDMIAAQKKISFMECMLVL